MEQMLTMECSEEESVCGSERNEEWGIEDPNRMDFEHELVDDVPDEAFNVSSSIMGKPNTELSVLLQASEIKKQQYEEILKNQVENIVDLQSACEKVSCLLEQLPMLKDQHSLRFNHVMSEMQSIREKQFQLNELVEYTVQIYDDSMKFAYTMKEEFAEHQRMNDERRTVFDLDVQGFPEIGNTIYAEIEQRIKKKRDYCWLVNNYLAEVVNFEHKSKELNVKIDIAFKEATDLNKQLLDYESQLELYRRNTVTLKAEQQDEKNEFIKKMGVFLKREEEFTEQLIAVTQKVEELMLQSLSSNHIELQNEVRALQEKLETLKKGKQDKASCLTTLECHLADLTNQERTLTESLSGLTRCKDIVILLEEEVKSLEAELNEMSLKSGHLNKLCEELAKQTAEYENFLGEARGRIIAFEKEYAKISPDASSLKNTLQKRRAELNTIEKKMSDEMVRVQSEIDGMNRKLDENRKMFEEYQNKFNALLHHKETQKAIMKEKNSVVTQKELCMNSIIEELEECKVEIDDLIEQKKNALEHKNEVDQLDNELSDERKKLALVNENSSKNFTKLNEINNKQIEEAVKEIENRKQEYMSALEDKAKETSILEEEFKLIQTSAASFSKILKDVKKQAEIFKSEQSLLSSFSNWVFDEGTQEPTAEPWVTSTSDNNVHAAESANHSQDGNFEVRDIKTACNTE